MICKGQHGQTQIKMTWPTTRGPGFPRLGPYQLTIGTQKFRLDDKIAPAKGAKFIKIHEVGYWLSEGRLLLRLTDDQLTRTLIHLHIDKLNESQSGQIYSGDAFFEVYDPGISRKLQMSCRWDG